MDRMAYEGGQSPAVSSWTVLDRCPRCNGELDTGYRCVACGWSRYTSSGNVGAYVGAPPISPLPARGALDELLADGDWEGFEPMRERVRAELAALREENARLREACRAFAAEGISKDCAGEVVAVPIERLREIEWAAEGCDVRGGEVTTYEACPVCGGSHPRYGPNQPSLLGHAPRLLAR